MGLKEDLDKDWFGTCIKLAYLIFIIVLLTMIF
jgi:hypothetical protein